MLSQDRMFRLKARFSFNTMTPRLYLVAPIKLLAMALIPFSLVLPVFSFPLTPDPLHSLFYDSHPPASIRIAHLKAC
jgi:hypothetical protein